MSTLPLALVGDGYQVRCASGAEVPYLSLDAAASTAALPQVVSAVDDFLPLYSSVHRGAGFKSQFSTHAYEGARTAALLFASRDPSVDTALICRNTTEAINHLAFRLGLTRDDVVVTTVVEHHANLLPWRRYAQCRYVECDEDGTVGVESVEEALDLPPRPRLLAITGASNITGWCPDLAAITEAAKARGVPVLVDGAQLAPHRPLPAAADFVAFSGHKMYAPFGAGILLGPRAAFGDGEPFLAGGGAVELVDLDEVLWSEPPEREEAGSPNVIGAVALHAAMEGLRAVGWDSVAEHDRVVGRRLREGLAALPGVRVLGPAGRGDSAALDLLPVATFTVDGFHHALVAARLSVEHGIGVRHGCFCAHPYLMRLLGLSHQELDEYRAAVRRGDRSAMPGAVRASSGINTSENDIDRLVAALGAIVVGGDPPVPYVQDPATGEFSPDPDSVPWFTSGGVSPACGRG